MKTIKYTITLIAILASVMAFQSCNGEKATTAKIFVRTQSNELVSNAKVVLIAEKNTNESNIEYVDTLITNTSGYVQFDLADYYEEAGKSTKVATFFVLCRKANLEGTGKIRTRVKTTAVETVYIVE